MAWSVVLHAGLENILRSCKRSSFGWSRPTSQTLALAVCFAERLRHSAMAEPAHGNTSGCPVTMGFNVDDAMNMSPLRPTSELLLYWMGTMWRQPLLWRISRSFCIIAGSIHWADKVFQE